MTLELNAPCFTIGTLAEVRAREGNAIRELTKLAPDSCWGLCRVAGPIVLPSFAGHGCHVTEVLDVWYAVEENLGAVAQVQTLSKLQREWWAAIPLLVTGCPPFTLEATLVRVEALARSCPALARAEFLVGGRESDFETFLDEHMGTLLRAWSNKECVVEALESVPAQIRAANRNEVDGAVRKVIEAEVLQLNQDGAQLPSDAATRVFAEFMALGDDAREPIRSTALRPIANLIDEVLFGEDAD